MNAADTADMVDMVDTKLAWIITIAERIKSYFSSDSSALLKLAMSEIDNHKVVAAHQKVVCDDNIFMIISTDPKQLLIDIVERVKAENSEKLRTELNPVTLLTKLANQEYLLDMNGTRLCYAVYASISSKYVLKLMACKLFSSVRVFYNNIDSDTKMLTNIEELDPQYDYSTSLVIGGKKKKHRNKQSNKKSNKQPKKTNVRLEIIERIMKFVEGNEEIMKGIVFVNDISECRTMAMNIIYTEYRFKSAIVDYLKILISTSYKKYKFKAFVHNDFKIPYDFRIIKHSCLLNHIESKQPVYVANMYNIGAYAPVPCVPSQSIHMAHPIIKLYMLYIDVFMLEHKTKKLAPNDHLINDKLIEAFDEVRKFIDDPEWIGYYKDEIYDKNQFNMESKTIGRISMII